MDWRKVRIVVSDKFIHAITRHHVITIRTESDTLFLSSIAQFYFNLYFAEIAFCG